MIATRHILPVAAELTRLALRTDKSVAGVFTIAPRQPAPRVGVHRVGFLLTFAGIPALMESSVMPLLSRRDGVSVFIWVGSDHLAQRVTRLTGSCPR